MCEHFCSSPKMCIQRGCRVAGQLGGQENRLGGEGERSSDRVQESRCPIVSNLVQPRPILFDRNVVQLLGLAGVEKAAETARRAAT